MLNSGITCLCNFEATCSVGDKVDFSLRPSASMRPNAWVLSGFLACAVVGISTVRQTGAGETILQLGDVSYFANTAHPAGVLSVDDDGSSWDGPVTIIHTNATAITARILEDTLNDYEDGDDVFSMAFTSTMMIMTSVDATIRPSAMEYLASIKSTHAITGPNCAVNAHQNVKNMTVAETFDLPPGPYFASFKDGSLLISKVYRLYEDTHRDFLYGAYALEEGTGRFASLGVTVPQFSYPAIPVPSRIYSWNDPRPFAGYRVAVKDLFDMKSLVTTGGSQAWALINPPANATAPSIQRILDLGGVLVGKYKLAQFASGANPWEWQDEYECHLTLSLR